MKKQSLYYFDKGRIYRPTRQELESKTFICPVCKTPLYKTKQKLIVKIHLCKSCGFMIEHDNVLHTRQQIDEYLTKLKDVLVDQIMEEVTPQQQITAKGKSNSVGDASIFLQQQGFFNDPIGSNDFNDGNRQTDNEMLTTRHKIKDEKGHRNSIDLKERFLEQNRM
jgi:transcription elongation factor Elf1